MNEIGIQILNCVWDGLNEATWTVKVREISSYCSVGQHKQNQKQTRGAQLLVHDTHADIITIQETKLTPKAKTPKVHNFTTVLTDRLHKAGGGLITLIRDNRHTFDHKYTQHRTSNDQGTHIQH